MTATVGQQFNWQSMIQRSFLSIYQSKAEPNDCHIYQGYDFVFHFEHVTLYLLVNHNIVKTNSLQIEKSALHQLRYDTVSQLLKRQNQLYRRNLAIEATKQPEDKVVVPTGSRVYFVGLTSLSIEYQRHAYGIDHKYGSQFFAEECVLDLDNKDSVIQIFSVQNFVQMMEKLGTPSDLLTFLGYHRPILIEQRHYDNEMALVERFMHEAIFYQRAISVQERLVKIDLLEEVEDRLIMASNAVEVADTKSLIDKMQRYGKMWYTLLRGLTKRLHQAGNPLPLELVRKLIDESMYTRMSIMEEVMAYGEMPLEDRLQGYIRHQHSYNQFGRHYILVFYAQDSNSALSREAVHKQHQDVLFDVNRQLQSPVMEDLFLLGFDMSNHDEKGQTEVRMEVFHQQGSELTIAIKCLYEQLEELKARNEMLEELSMQSYS